jgi:hypothetical protein
MHRQENTMGFFSFQTSDTKTSIYNVQSQLFADRPVFMLQPMGRSPIRESAYEGYGVFGGIDAHEWLFNTNARSFGLDPNDFTADERRIMGISLELGSVSQDIETGELWSNMTDMRPFIGGEYFPGTYADPIPRYFKSLNELKSEGRLRSVEICDLIDIPYPLKFSFDYMAEYDALPAAKPCPHQGYF